MKQMSKIETPVATSTATALSDTRRLAAVSRSVDRLVRPSGDDPLIALFERTAADAARFGLTETEIEAELDVYNAQHRACAATTPNAIEIIKDTLS